MAALVLPPFINVGRYKGRVIESMSKALGRPVTCDSIELRLLPQPGFYLDNVAIGDDPAYSARADPARRRGHRLPQPQFALARTAGDRPAQPELSQPQPGRARGRQLEPGVAAVEGLAHSGRAHLGAGSPIRVRAFPTLRRPTAASTSSTDWRKASSPSPMPTSLSGVRRRTSGA